MRLDELVPSVDLRRQEEFLGFVRTVEASEEFLNYLDTDPTCQDALETAFAEQAAAFEELARLVGDPAALAAAVPGDRAEELASQLVSSLRSTALELSREERQAVVERVGRALNATIPLDKRGSAHALVAELEDVVSRSVD